MNKGDELLAIACRELGYHEGKNKDNKYGRWFGLNNDAWCLIFQQWCYAQAGIPLPYKAASNSALLSWYERNQPECIVTEPVKGCLVIFDLPTTKARTEHVGMFESMSGQYITTIDGNTSAQNDANGGYVNRRTREKKYVYRYIVPRGLAAESEEDDMKRFNTMAEIRAYSKDAATAVQKLIKAKALGGTTGKRDAEGNPEGLNLSEDMLRTFVVNDRMGVYK